MVSQLLDLIPPVNLRLLASLMKHLNFVSTFKDKNRMDAANLAIVWGPILLRPRVETMETVLADVAFVNSFIAFIIQQPDYFFKRKLAKLDKGEKKEDNQGTLSSSSLSTPHHTTPHHTTPHHTTSHHTTLPHHTTPQLTPLF